MKKTIVYVDMDNVLVDFESGIDNLTEWEKKEYEERLDEVPGIFSRMEPMKDAIESYRWLHDNFDTYILSTAPWENPSAWSDKLIWVKKYLPEAYKRLILSHNKNLNAGDFIIDDRTKNGVDNFKGTHIHFGESDTPDWRSVIEKIKQLTL